MFRYEKLENRFNGVFTYTRGNGKRLNAGLSLHEYYRHPG